MYGPLRSPNFRRDIRNNGKESALHIEGISGNTCKFELREATKIEKNLDIAFLC
jgi:hypothetical protein